ncbi:MAG: peptide deformylase [Deltaproteobacteria bacterium]|nr:peptide deformylase [Deltaproteobacteria bacterium]
MALLEILKYPHPLLKKRASAVGAADSSIKSLMEDMLETMYHNKGVGLAANQVGVDKRVIVLDAPKVEIDTEIAEGKPEGKEVERVILKLVNPEVAGVSGEIRYEEGCLSLPGITAYVKRDKNMVVKAQDEDGRNVEINASGLISIVLQHEIDHINGILFVDRLSRLRRELILRKFKKAMEAERVL